MRLFVTIVRFDAVYVVHFKCCHATIAGGRFPRLHAWLRDVYQLSAGSAACVAAGSGLATDAPPSPPAALLLAVAAGASTCSTSATTTTARTARSTPMVSYRSPSQTTGRRRTDVTPQNSPWLPPRRSDGTGDSPGGRDPIETARRGLGLPH